MKIITDLFQKVLNFYTLLVSSSWIIDSTSGTAVHPSFSLLCSTYDSFKESTCFLLTGMHSMLKTSFYFLSLCHGIVEKVKILFCFFSDNETCKSWLSASFGGTSTQIEFQLLLWKGYLSEILTVVGNA